MAREGESAARHPWRGTRAEHDAAGGRPRTGQHRPQATRGVDRGGAAESGQWEVAWQTHDVGRTGAGASGAVHGDDDRGETQPERAQAVRATAEGWQTTAGSTGGVHA